jgi:hypothetical protein
MCLEANGLCIHNLVRRCGLWIVSGIEFSERHLAFLIFILILCEFSTGKVVTKMATGQTRQWIIRESLPTEVERSLQGMWLLVLPVFGLQTTSPRLV